MAILSFKKRSIPNWLTILRIILTIPIIVFFFINNLPIAYSFNIDNQQLLIYWNQIIIGILFIVASLSDFLDGYLSRKFNWTSNFGKFWDPLADKILINTCFILLASKNLTHFSIVIVFFLRDIIVDGLRMYASKQTIVIPANFYGKLKTIFQITAIIILLFFGSYFNEVIWWKWGVLNLFTYISVLVSVLSGLVYGISYKKILRNQYLEN